MPAHDGAEFQPREAALFPLRLLPRLSCDPARSVFRIGRVALSLFLAGKVSHREAVSLDGPPTFRRPIRPRLDRHHHIGFVGVVVGHFFPFTPNLTGPATGVDQPSALSPRSRIVNSRPATSSTDSSH